MKKYLNNCKKRVKEFLGKPGGAFWIKWCITFAAVFSAFVTGGNMFILIALGGGLGIMAGIILDAISEYRKPDGSFNLANATITLAACGASYTAFFYPVSPQIILGSMLSSGLMLTLLMKRLDPETGMNIQVGFHLLAVLAALGMTFYYAGPYLEWIIPVSALLSVALYIWMLLRLRDGAETGLRGAWYLAAAMGLALFSATAMLVLNTPPSPAASFAGLVTGLGAATSLAPLRTATGWVCDRIAEEREYRKF